MASTRSDNIPANKPDKSGYKPRNNSVLPRRDFRPLRIQPVPDNSTWISLECRACKEWRPETHQRLDQRLSLEHRRLNLDQPAQEGVNLIILPLCALILLFLGFCAQAVNWFQTDVRMNKHMEYLVPVMSHNNKVGPEEGRSQPRNNQPRTKLTSFRHSKVSPGEQNLLLASSNSNSYTSVFIEEVPTLENAKQSRGMERKGSGIKSVKSCVKNKSTEERKVLNNLDSNTVPVVMYLDRNKLQRQVLKQLERTDSRSRILSTGSHSDLTRKYLELNRQHSDLTRQYSDLTRNNSDLARQHSDSLQKQSDLSRKQSHTSSGCMSSDPNSRTDSQQDISNATSISELCSDSVESPIRVLSPQNCDNLIGDLISKSSFVLNIPNILSPGTTPTPTPSPRDSNCTTPNGYIEDCFIFPGASGRGSNPRQSAPRSPVMEDNAVATGGAASLCVGEQCFKLGSSVSSEVGQSACKGQTRGQMQCESKKLGQSACKGQTESQYQCQGEILGQSAFKGQTGGQATGKGEELGQSAHNGQTRGQTRGQTQHIGHDQMERNGNYGNNKNQGTCRKSRPISPPCTLPCGPHALSSCDASRATYKPHKMNTDSGESGRVKGVKGNEKGLLEQNHMKAGHVKEGGNKAVERRDETDMNLAGLGEGVEQRIEEKRGCKKYRFLHFSISFEDETFNDFPSPIENQTESETEAHREYYHLTRLSQHSLDSYDTLSPKSPTAITPSPISPNSTTLSRKSPNATTPSPSIRSTFAMATDDSRTTTHGLPKTFYIESPSSPTSPTSPTILLFDVRRANRKSEETKDTRSTIDTDTMKGETL